MNVCLLMRNRNHLTSNDYSVPSNENNHAMTVEFIANLFHLKNSGFSDLTREVRLREEGGQRMQFGMEKKISTHASHIIGRGGETTLSAPVEAP